VQSFLFANYHKQRRLFLSSTFSSVRLPTTTPMSTAIKASITADVGVASSVVATSVAVNGAAEFVTVSEGTANMQYDAKEAVFYNKVMTFNRDFSIQVIRLFAEVMAKERSDKYEEKMNKYKEGKSEIDREPFAPPDGISILDALAATGLRSVRFMKEIPGIKHLTINDLLPQATDVAAANCKLNGVEASKITISNGDATMLMFQRRAPVDQFDVIDLDPYGSAAPFLDSAVQAVSHGGLLCVTCTDMPVLTGSFPEVRMCLPATSSPSSSSLHFFFSSAD
jgi:tRNA(guanine-26,N2-N2) methyltransferase